jgi:hypothetical protein
VIVDVATIAEGIVEGQSTVHRAGGGKEFAPGVVVVLNDKITVPIDNCYHITLLIQDIEISRISLGTGHRMIRGL